MGGTTWRPVSERGGSGEEGKEMVVPAGSEKGHRGAVCREETILWWAAAAGCERDRFRVSLPLFYLSKLPPGENSV